MCLETLYKILDNASIAAILGIAFATFFARREYIKQKDSDRDSEVKIDLITDILFLQEKVHYALLVIDRISNSFSITTMETKEFLEKGLNIETPKLSNAINEEIPASLLKISSKINIYYDNRVVETRFNDFMEELKKWHEPVVKIKFDLIKRVKDQPILSVDEFDKKTKLLIKAIWQEKTTYQLE